MLLKKKIIASSISNLTDARYFAGWMVDYIVFNIDPKHEFYTNPQEIGGFQSWVEGPEYFLEMNLDQLDSAEKYLVDFDCKAVLINYNKRNSISEDIPVIFRITLDELVSAEPEDLGEKILLISGVSNIEQGFNSINKLELNNELFLELTESSITEEQLLGDYVSGYMVHGSPEEKVGFKSFDELDEIFEVLQDF
ncbi:hypothetical protein N9B82_03600 [Saprospiraceae bacterium]|nr:hypothetical protein [Saprospiraceae bacterium]